MKMQMEKEIPIFRSLFRVFDFYVAYVAPETTAGAVSSFGLMCVYIFLSCLAFDIAVLENYRLQRCGAIPFRISLLNYTSSHP